MSDLVRIELNADEVVYALERMQERSMRMRPFMSAVGLVMIKATHDNFDEQGRPSRWKGWSPLTLKIIDQAAMSKATSSRKSQAGREKEYQRLKARRMSNKILQDTGALRQSVMVGHVTETSVEVGSSLPYARIHQLGGVIKPKKASSLVIPIGGGRVIKLKKATIPARPYLALTTSDMGTIVRIAEDYLIGGEIR